MPRKVSRISSETLLDHQQEEVFCDSHGLMASKVRIELTVGVQIHLASIPWQPLKLVSALPLCEIRFAPCEISSRRRSVPKPARLALILVVEEVICRAEPLQQPEKPSTSLS